MGRVASRKPLESANSEHDQKHSAHHVRCLPKKFRDELFILTHSTRRMLTNSVVINHRTVIRSPSFNKNCRGSHPAEKSKFDETKLLVVIRPNQPTTNGMFRLKNENSLPCFPSVFPCHSRAALEDTGNDW